MPPLLTIDASFVKNIVLKNYFFKRKKIKREAKNEKGVAEPPSHEVEGWFGHHLSFFFFKKKKKKRKKEKIMFRGILESLSKKKISCATHFSFNLTKNAYS
jgi:hypothetical protein